MKENIDSSQSGEFLSIKQAAKALGLRPSTVYQYVREEKITSEVVADKTVIRRSEITDYKHRIAGRPRKSVPRWFFTAKNNELLVTTIDVDLRSEPGAPDFRQALEKIKQEDAYLFPGTIARYIWRDHENEGLVRFLFIWRRTAMPSDDAIEAMQAALRSALSHVLDWEAARYSVGTVVMHA
jgi:excisionase family DNA binding protein